MCPKFVQSKFHRLIIGLALTYLFFLFYYLILSCFFVLAFLKNKTVAKTLHQRFHVKDRKKGKVFAQQITGFLEHFLDIHWLQACFSVSTAQPSRGNIFTCRTWAYWKLHRFDLALACYRSFCVVCVHSQLFLTHGGSEWTQNVCLIN